MGNIEGLNSLMYYLEADSPRIARIDSIPTIISGNDGPGWFVQIPGQSTWQGPFPWLRYLGTDGRMWSTHTHVQRVGMMNGTNNPAFNTWWESKQDDGSGNNPTFQIVDWNYVKWQVIGYYPSPQENGPWPVQIKMSKTLTT